MPCRRWLAIEGLRANKCTIWLDSDTYLVMPAQAGIHDFSSCGNKVVDADLHRHDGTGDPAPQLDSFISARTLTVCRRRRRKAARVIVAPVARCGDALFVTPRVAQTQP
jgi:hypothetical protein